MTEMKGDPGPAAAEDKVTSATTVAVADTAVADGDGSSSDGELTVIEIIESGASAGESEGGDLWKPSGIGFDPDEKERGEPAPQDSADLRRRLETIRRALLAGPDQSWTGLYPTLGSGWDDKEISDLREIKAKLLAGSGTALAGVLTASVLAWANFWKAEAASEKSEDPAGEEETSKGIASAYIVGGSMAAFGGGFYAYNEARKYYSLVRTHNIRLLKDHLKKINDNAAILDGMEDLFQEAAIELEDDVAELLESTRAELAAAKEKTNALIDTRKSEAYELDELTRVEDELQKQRAGLEKRAQDLRAKRDKGKEVEKDQEGD